MEADFWHARWGKNEIGFHQSKINQHLEQFWQRLDAPKNRSVFVPLCGKSKDMIWLQNQGYTVLGIELSRIAVQDFFSENGLTPIITQYKSFEQWTAEGFRILVGDFFQLTAEDLIACGSIYDRASLIALPPDMRKLYVEHLAMITPKFAKTLLVTMEYPQEQMSGPPFAVWEDEVNALYQAYFSIERWNEIDILPESPGFRNRGLNYLHEKTYCLTPKS